MAALTSRIPGILIALLIGFWPTIAHAEDELPVIPSFKGEIGITFPSNQRIIDFLAENNGQLVFINAVMSMDVATPYNYQLLQLCSSEESGTDDDPYAIPADMERLLNGEIASTPIGLPYFVGDGEPQNAIDDSGLFADGTIVCTGYSIFFETDDNSMFHFSSGGTGIVTHAFKGFFDVFVSASGASLHFSLVPVSDFAVELRVKSGAL